MLRSAAARSTTRHGVGNRAKVSGGIASGRGASCACCSEEVMGSEAMVVPSLAVDVLEHAPDMFGGIIVEPGQLPADAEEFAERLQFSLDTWRDEGRRLVWVDVPLNLAELIPVATKAGFV